MCVGVFERFEKFEIINSDSVCSFRIRFGSPNLIRRFDTTASRFGCH